MRRERADIRLWQRGKASAAAFMRSYPYRHPGRRNFNYKSPCAIATKLRDFVAVRGEDVNNNSCMGV